MSLNVEKFKVRHIGDKILSFKYQMRDQELELLKQAKSRGVIISNTLQISNQCTAAGKIANKSQAFIARSIVHKLPYELKMAVYSICKLSTGIRWIILVNKLHQV